MRALKAAVAIMGVMIVAGVAVLAFAIAQRLGSVAPGAAAPITLDEPPGTRIIAASGLADRLTLTLQGGGPDRVLVLDPRSGRILARAALVR